MIPLGERFGENQSMLQSSFCLPTRSYDLLSMSEEKHILVENVETLLTSAQRNILFLSRKLRDMLHFVSPHTVCHLIYK